MRGVTVMQKCNFVPWSYFYFLLLYTIVRWEHNGSIWFMRFSISFFQKVRKSERKSIYVWSMSVRGKEVNITWNRIFHVVDIFWKGDRWMVWMKNDFIWKALNNVIKAKKKQFYLGMICKRFSWTLNLQA